MGGVCCSTRDSDSEFMENGKEVIIKTETRNQFRQEILKTINKEQLHNEVLEHQNVLDFDSYKHMMSLVTVYVTNLTLLKNQKTFTHRLHLLAQDSNNPTASEEYASLLNELCSYQVRL